MTIEDDFTQAAKRDLARLVEATSPQVRARLDRMVDDVLQGRAAARPRARRPGWARVGWPLGAVAATFVAATFGLALMFRQEPPASPADDVALLLNVDNFELLDQMEFYQWLDRQPGILEGDVATPPPSQRS